MSQINNQEQSNNIQFNLSLILEEHQQLFNKLDFSQISEVTKFLSNAERIFVCGAGRSGLAMRCAAMRLMHFGLNVFVVGETTTPAIKAGDLLIAASGSGTTKSIVQAAEKAVSVGARVISFSTTSNSPLADFSQLVVIIPAAQKQDHEKTLSAQYAGSLFEQSLLLLTDAIFQTMWTDTGVEAEELWERHANLE
jgi:6-phospho-3-hexuloisomerase